MKHLYLTLLAFLVFAPAFAQKDFRPGYILRDGDTLHGSVDYRGAVRNAKQATFKAGENDAEQVYLPSQISGYGFKKEQKAYEAHQLAATEAQPEQQLFLQLLVKGRVSLYTYRDESDQDRFYLSKDGGELVELKELVYHRKDPQSGKTYRVVERPYLGTLASAFIDCPALTEQQLENVTLRHNALVKVATAYNQCMGSEQFRQQARKTSVRFSPVLTFSKPSLHLSGDHLYAQGTYSGAGIGFGGGIAMEVVSPVISEKLSLLLELLYAPYRLEGRIESIHSSGRTTDYDLLFDLNYIKLPAQLRYTFPKGKIRPFANAGASFSYAVKADRVETRTSTFHNSSYTETVEALEGSNFKKHMFGAVLGAGLIIPVRQNALLVEARYETTEGISNKLTLASSIKSAGLLVGYRF